jgi:UDP-N-acetylglucosamine transferase subunit ALG13
LGHTTRCIPVISELIRLNCTVIIACNSSQKALLLHEFPSLSYIDLPGYNLFYGKKRTSTLALIFFQLPKILTRIKQEHTWLTTLLDKQPITAVISDNRFGLYSTRVPCIFITHQLAIQSGLGRFVNYLARKWNYGFIKRFTACWVPDYKGPSSLAGQLSNPKQLPSTTINYLGGLSRFQSCPPGPATIDLLIILSGPEPQRTIFENRLLHDLKNYPGHTVLVRGLPADRSIIEPTPSLTIHNHVSADKLNKLICAAGIIISRCGYTTVMDVLKLGKKSIMVPTPGQPEQEYIARYLHNRQLVFTVSQQDFSLQPALTACGNFSFSQQSLAMDEYKVVLQEFVQSLQVVK